jgi:outer membrane biosynthesis protein TonB
MSTATVNPQSGAGTLPKPVAPPAAAPAADAPRKIAEQGLTMVEEKKLAMAEKPAGLTKPVPAPDAPPREAPREIAALKSQLTASGVAQTGIAAFNVAGSPFGAYDKAIIRAVQSRWYRLISQNALYERTGEVTVHFDLMADGSVQNMTVKNNTAGQILALFCEKAVVDSAPFAPLPEELRELIGGEPRDVNFTFYY